MCSRERVRQIRNKLRIPTNENFRKPLELRWAKEDFFKKHYSKDKTLQEMADASGFEKPRIHSWLHDEGLEWKTEYSHARWKEEFRKDADGTLTMKQLAEKWDVALMSVHRWIKIYNLPYKKNVVHVDWVPRKRGK
jgi:hypothetical protein